MELFLINFRLELKDLRKFPLKVFKGNFKFIFMNFDIEKSYTKKWEVSIIELEDAHGKLYKVTRRLAHMSVAETKIFRDKEEAKTLFCQWLD